MNYESNLFSGDNLELKFLAKWLTRWFTSLQYFLVRIFFLKMSFFCHWITNLHHNVKIFYQPLISRIISKGFLFSFYIIYLYKFLIFTIFYFFYSIMWIVSNFFMICIKQEAEWPRSLRLLEFVKYFIRKKNWFFFTDLNVFYGF